MPGGSERGRIDDVEKGIRSFHKAVTAEYERLAPAGAMDIAERRRIAEIVRKPWSGGGPPMVETLDLRVGKLNVPIRVHTRLPIPRFRCSFIYTAAAGCCSAWIPTTG